MTAVTWVALARFRASIQKSNSMKLSLTGCSVPWITKTSRPRTFSRTRTKTLPSLKILVSDRAHLDRPGASRSSVARVPTGPPREDFQLAKRVNLFLEEPYQSSMVSMMSVRSPASVLSVLDIERSVEA